MGHHFITLLIVDGEVQRQGAVINIVLQSVVTLGQ